MIAGAGGAAHLPGMTAAKTRLPVLGVPVKSRALERHRLAALDRPDAARRPGRDASRSASPAPRTRHCSPPRSSPTSTRRSRRRSTSIAPRRPPQVLEQPDPRRALAFRDAPRGSPQPRRSAATMNRKRVGIVGAGQLGRMLALAGYPLGDRLPPARPRGRRAGRASRGRACSVRSTTRRARASSPRASTCSRSRSRTSPSRALEAVERACRRVPAAALRSRSRRIVSPRRRCSARSEFRPRQFVAIDSDARSRRGASAARLADRLEDAAHGLRRPRPAHRRFRGAPRGGVARARPCCRRSPKPGCRSSAKSR